MAADRTPDVLVVGAGAVGSLLAWALRRGGLDVAIVRRGHEGGPQVRQLTVIDRAGERRRVDATVVARPVDLPAPPRAILFAVKMPDLAEAVRSVAAWPGVPALTVENGIGAEELVAAARPDAGLIAGSLTASVEPAEDGAYRWLSRGGLGMASVRGDMEPLLSELAAAFEAAGLRTRRFPDAAAMKWSKLLGNLAANATSALLDRDAGRIYRNRGLFDIERRQLLETLAVMDHLGLHPVALPGADVRLLALAMRLPQFIGRPVLAAVLGGARGGKDPSLRIHMTSGRSGPSEVEWLNGAVARAGAAAGVPTPVNARLTELLLAAEADPGRHAAFRGNPKRLVDAISADPG